MSGIRTMLICRIIIIICLFPSGGYCKRFSLKRHSATTAVIPPSLAAVGVKGYRRFHANDSLIGRPLSCTRDEKICLRHNLIFNPMANRCYPLQSEYSKCDIVADRTKLGEGRSGHIVGICRDEDRCFGYRMAFDGRCYRKTMVHSILCGCASQPTRHLLGGLECRCKYGAPTLVEQPKEDGRCVIPDFRFPYNNDLSIYILYPNAPMLMCSDNQCIEPSTKSHQRCSSAQSKCFSKGMVWVSARYGCFKLLERGPCENNYRLVLSHDAKLNQLVICMHIRGECPPGQKRMAFDHRCHDDREIDLMAPGDIVSNVYGEYVFEVRETMSFKPVVVSGNCIIKIDIIRKPGRSLVNLESPCGKNNYGDCATEAYAELPLPLDDYLSGNV